MREESRRGTSRQAAPRRQWYPQWGLEEPRREWSGWSFYRHGRKSLLDRYILTPNRFFTYGVTVLDIIAAFAVAGFILLLGQAVGIGTEGYLQRMGW